MFGYYADRFKSFLKTFIGEFFYALPEGQLKTSLRVAYFKFDTHLPMRALVNKGDVVVQAGCWRTETMEEWAKAVGPKGDVIVIEADDVNANILDVEIKRRGLDNVTLVRKAVWHEPTTVELQVSDFSDRNKLKDSQTYSPRQSPENYEAEKEVPGDSIDNIVEEAGVETVDHVHMTISGAEIEAIEGMTETLRNPGVRLFVRAILCHEEEDVPINREVARMLEDRGLNVTLAKQEPNRGNGGNVYAWRPE